MDEAERPDQSEPMGTCGHLRVLRGLAQRRLSAELTFAIYDEWRHGT